MRTIKLEYNVLKFNELNEDQKNKVISKLHDINLDHDFLSDTIEQFKNDLETLGFKNIKIEYSGFNSQGDGACFTGIYSIPTNEETKSRFKKFTDNCGIVEFVKLANELMTLDFMGIEDDLDALEIYKKDSLWRYSNSNTVKCNTEILDEWAKRYMDMIYKKLESEWEYMSSKEAIIETIEANDYEFNENTLNIE